MTCCTCVVQHMTEFIVLNQIWNLFSSLHVVWSARLQFSSWRYFIEAFIDSIYIISPRCLRQQRARKRTEQIESYRGSFNFHTGMHDAIEARPPHSHLDSANQTLKCIWLWAILRHYTSCHLHTPPWAAQFPSWACRCGSPKAWSPHWFSRSGELEGVWRTCFPSPDASDEDIYRVIVCRPW